MDIILIPGLWLDGSSWDKVLPTIEAAGHRAHALTLPGMESNEADRSKISLRDHVDAVIAEIDAVDPPDGKVLLVGHSAGAAIAYAAVDARPDRVARLVAVGGFPVGDGDAVADGYPARNGEVPLPDWSTFEDEDLADLDDKARSDFRDRAIPSPEHVTRDPQRLSDERRYDVPLTVIATEFTSEMLQGWIAQGHAPVREFTKIRDVAYVDLPTGHWPQFTRPEDLGRAILTSINGAASSEFAVAPAAELPKLRDMGEMNRPDPPVAGDESATLVGFLEYPGARPWRGNARGLDAAGLRATVGVSSMTLGGLLKHMAYVEDHLVLPGGCNGRDPAGLRGTRWTGTADPDWEWQLGRRGLTRAAARALAGRRGPVPLPARGRRFLIVRPRAGWPGAPGPAGETPSLRWILVHMIEEYARHNGHADLLREPVDGLTGE